MTVDECRRIFKNAWYKSIQRELYPTNSIMLPMGEIMYFMRDISMELFPENNSAGRYDFDAGYLTSTTEGFAFIGTERAYLNYKPMVAGIGPDHADNPDGWGWKTKETQSFTDINKGDGVHIVIENDTLLKKMTASFHKVVTCIYLGDNLLFHRSLGCVIDFEEWKNNIEWTPRLVAHSIITGDTSKTLDEDGKQVRPHGDDDITRWREFWSKL